jgi:hypothetical protein
MAFRKSTQFDRSIHLVVVLVLFVIIVIDYPVLAFAGRDTIEVSYAKTPDISVAGVYMDVTQKIAFDEHRQISFLKTNDLALYKKIKDAIDTVALRRTDPNEIVAIVRRHGGSPYELQYVRLALTIMTDRLEGFRTPYRVKMVFDEHGFLEHLECRGFMLLSDGFVLKKPFLDLYKVHRSHLEKFKPVER